MSVLYLTYDGLMEPLGQSQVLPYLRHLARGREITLVTYEKGRDLDDAARRTQFEAIVRRTGIRWIPLRYHNRPSALATAYDLAVGLAVCVWVCVTRRIRIVHARSYVPAVLALALKRLFGVRFIFDMRGFWIDGRVEAGLLREGSTVFRVARWFETRFLQQADIVFALSAAAVAMMKGWPALKERAVRFEVVPTCTDLDLFRPSPDQRALGDKPLTLGYVGNAGRGYLFEPVLDLYAQVRAIEPEARLKIVNRNDHALIRERLDARGIGTDQVELLASDYPDVHKHMWDMDMGLFFYQWRAGSQGDSVEGLSSDETRRGAASAGNVSTRMGEFLACGLPCVGNGGGGGMVDVLASEGVAILLNDLDEESVRQAASAAVALTATHDLRSRCVEAARRYFSLESGVAIYERAYRQLEGAAS